MIKERRLLFNPELYAPRPRAIHGIGALQECKRLPIGALQRCKRDRRTSSKMMNRRFQFVQWPIVAVSGFLGLVMTLWVFLAE